MSNRMEQGYKSHTDLNIPEQLWLGLVWMKGMLEDGKIKYSDKIAAGELQYFNMNAWDCGTIGCIGGWVESKFNCKVNDEIVYNQKLSLLFFPDVDGYATITTKQAAMAIDSYLRMGDPQWGKITGREAKL